MLRFVVLNVAILAALVAVQALNVVQPFPLCC
jgi:hypothetical protein